MIPNGDNFACSLLSGALFDQVLERTHLCVAVERRSSSGIPNSFPDAPKTKWHKAPYINDWHGHRQSSRFSMRTCQNPIALASIPKMNGTLCVAALIRETVTFNIGMLHNSKFHRRSPWLCSWNGIPKSITNKLCFRARPGTILGANVRSHEQHEQIMNSWTISKICPQPFGILRVLDQVAVLFIFRSFLLKDLQASWSPVAKTFRSSSKSQWLHAECFTDSGNKPRRNSRRISALLKGPNEKR